jgi:GNAT superfamily N-acetyltransferase
VPPVGGPAAGSCARLYAAAVAVEITQAGGDRLATLASVMGRAFVTEPMLRWPLGDGHGLEERCVRCFELFLPNLIEHGLVWEAGDGVGAAVVIPPDKTDVWAAAQLNPAMHELAEDAERHDAFWEWVESKIPDERLWHWDSLGVEPRMQGRGIGSALTAFVVGLTAADKTGVVLETGTARNVSLYERFGFRVVEEADAPGGGPHVWFMRRDP